MSSSKVKVASRPASCKVDSVGFQRWLSRQPRKGRMSWELMAQATGLRKDDLAWELEKVRRRNIAHFYPGSGGRGHAGTLEVTNRKKLLRRLANAETSSGVSAKDLGPPKHQEEVSISRQFCLEQHHLQASGREAAYEMLAAKGWVERSEAGRVRFFAAIARCLRVARDAVRLLAWMVRRGQLGRAALKDEDEARGWLKPKPVERDEMDWKVRNLMDRIFGWGEAKEPARDHREQRWKADLVEIERLQRQAEALKKLMASSKLETA